MNLDPRSIPYRVVENTFVIIGIIVFSVFFSPGGGEGGGMDIQSTATFIFLGLGAVALWQTAYVKRYEYHITADTFDIQSGVFSRREREIPFERVQNVDIAQNVFQRIIGIAEVRMETAGGGDSEARLRYVSESEATRLQELISDKKRGDTTERDPGAPHDILFELEQRELAILGVTSANFRLFGLFVVGLSVLGSPVAAQQVEPRVALLLVLGPVVAIAALILLWIISGIQAVLRYYGFRLLRHEGELRYQRGLLQQYKGTIPLSKVQTLMIRENFIARALGYANMVIETAGYAPGQGSDSVESAVPIAKRNRVFELATTIEGVGDVEFQSPPKRAMRRYIGRYTLIVLAVTTVLGGIHLQFDVLADWYLGLVLLVLVPPAAYLKYVNLGYYYDENHVVTQSGFWTRRTTIVPYYRVQTVSDSQTIFQYRHGLGTLFVDTASSGGFWGGDAIALDIHIDDARELRELVHERFQESAKERLAEEKPVGPSDQSQRHHTSQFDDKPQFSE